MNARKLALTAIVSLCVSAGTFAFGGVAAWAVGPPVISEESFSNVSASEARVSAQIDPGGSPTTYTVEYGTGEPYASAGEVSLPAVEGAVGALVRLKGLTPVSLYHFHFVARNGFGKVQGADTTFTTPQALGASELALPDGREYELVSPATGNEEVYPPKGDVEDLNITAAKSDVFTPRPIRASADGRSLAFIAEPTGSGSGTGNQGLGSGDEWLARRTSSGWLAGDIQPGNTTAETEFTAFSSDLSVGFIRSSRHDRLTGEAPESCRVLYSRDSETSVYHALFTSTQTPGFCGGEGEPIFVGASKDDSMRYFQTSAALTQGSIETPGLGSDNLYESIAGHASLVNLLPDAQPDPDATFGGQSSAHLLSPDFSNAVSADGSRAFWTDLNTGIVYVREGGTRTVQVSAGSSPAQYWTASVDGHYAFYTEAGKLFRFNADRFDESASPESVALEEAREEIAGEGLAHENPGVHGVLGTSEDGSYVYFVAEGVLANNESGQKEKAIPQTCAEASRPGEGNPEESVGNLNGRGCNLYVLHIGEPSSFIATLAPKDNALPSPANQESGFGDWQVAPGFRTSEVTADGRHLLFESRQRVTGYDNGGSSSPEVEREVEVFVYDAEGGGRLSCASCDPSGAAPVVFAERHGAGTSVPVSEASTFVRRWMNEDGTRVFFDTGQALVAQDTDGTQDVYEWEQDGTGACRQQGGCVYLISRGSSPDNSFLADASTSGDDVFFVTRTPLVPGIGDQRMVMYDAHVCGEAAPCAHEAALACTGTGCQGVPPAAPLFATPASVTFSGVGNYALLQPVVRSKARSKPKAKCRKSFVRKHGKCVKRKSARKSSRAHSLTRRGK
jgi:hypothetical protein